LDKIEWARTGLDRPGIGWDESGQDWIEPDRSGLVQDRMGLDGVDTGQVWMGLNGCVQQWMNPNLMDKIGWAWIRWMTLNSNEWA
jgi:hypothetical protein